MTHYNRRDKNTGEIVEAVEECGFQWVDTGNAGDGFPDGVAVRRFNRMWCSVPIEIKGIYGKLTPAQETFDDKYPGLNHVCRTKQDVIETLRSYERMFKR